MTPEELQADRDYWHSQAHLLASELEAERGKRWCRCGDEASVCAICNTLPLAGNQATTEVSTSPAASAPENISFQDDALRREEPPQKLTFQRCEGRYPVPMQRDEPFPVTYRCGLPHGHLGVCGDSAPSVVPEDPRDERPELRRAPPSLSSAPTSLTNAAITETEVWLRKQLFIEGYVAGARDYEDGETGGDKAEEGEKEWDLRYRSSTEAVCDYCNGRKRVGYDQYVCFVCKGTGVQPPQSEAK